VIHTSGFAAAVIVKTGHAFVPVKSFELKVKAH